MSDLLKALVTTALIVLFSYTIAVGASSITYHPLDEHVRAFTPDKTARVVCYFVNVPQTDQADIFSSTTAPKIVNRSSGLSCLQFSNADFDSWLDRMGE